MFEALHEVGGVLVYGIPEFRLPKEIIREQVDYMRAMGVEFETDVVVGRTVTIDELMQEEGYDAVFIGTGAGLPQFMGIPGEHLNGVYSANEFLTRINLMHAYEFPRYDEPMVDLAGKNVAVIGGGNTAPDSIRSALRLGAGKAFVLYRRSEVEMPARAEEVKHAKQEGDQFPGARGTGGSSSLTDEEGGCGQRDVCAWTGEPDASGRIRPVPVPGSRVRVAALRRRDGRWHQRKPDRTSTTPGLEPTARLYLGHC